MYSLLKNIYLTVIPKKLRLRLNVGLRKIVAFFYTGNTYTCNVCNKHLRNFIQLQNGELVCPRCGSLPRQRRMLFLMDNELKPSKNATVLHFSPPMALYQVFKNRYAEYIATDMAGDFYADKHYDITDIDLFDNAIDCIICYHILEHVPNDSKAINELFRVLKPGGFALIQTPFKEGNCYENPSITSPTEREKHFGQHDHVRVYSVECLKNRLAQTGFLVEIFNFNYNMDNINGLKPQETVLLCKKA